VINKSKSFSEDATYCIISSQLEYCPTPQRTEHKIDITSKWLLFCRKEWKQNIAHIEKNTQEEIFDGRSCVSNQVVHSSHNKRWSLFQFLTDGYIVTCEQGTQSVGRLVDVVFVAECRVESAAGGE
jgi:hypothetical protein